MPGQSWWNWLGNAIPVVKWFVKGENHPQDATTNAIKSSGYNLNTGVANTPVGNISTKNNNMSNGKGNNIGNYLLPALSAGSSIIGAAVNANSQKKINEQQIQWAMQQYQMSRQDAIEFWERENQYNSPSEQMARLKEAGLNPHLVYGNGATATGGSINSPQYQTPSLRAPQWGDALTGAGNVLASQMMVAQIEKTKAETRRIDVDQEAQAFDLAVKNRVGLDRLSRELDNKVASSNARTAKEVREFDAWLMAAMPHDPNNSNFEQDQFGTYQLSGDSPITRSISAGFESNELINKAKQAGIEQTIVEIQNLKKRGILYDDQHAINQIEVKLRDFTQTLTKVGISPGSVQALTAVTAVLKAIFSNK